MPEPRPGDPDYIAVPEQPHLRELPRSVHPRDGEAFPSWMLRLSARLGLDPATTMDEVGLVGRRGDRLKKPLGYGVTLTRQQKANISRTTRLTIERVEATLLRSYADSAIDFRDFNIQDPQGLRRLALREWALFNQSNLCVGCHHDSGGAWQLSWKLPWHALCLEHSILLSNTCPGCEQPFMMTSTNGVYGPPLPSLIPDVDVCNNALPPGLARRGRTAERCNFRLSSIEPVRVRHEGIASAQETFLDALESGSRSQAWWLDARSLTAVVLRFADPGFFEDVLPSPPAVITRAIIDHYDRLRDKSYRREEYDDAKSGPRTRTLTETPRDTAMMAATLPITQPVLDAAHGYGHADVAADVLRHLYRAVRRSGGHVTLHGLLINRHASQGLVDLAAAQSSRTSFTQSAISGTPDAWSITAANIPQLWWPERYDEIRFAFEPSGTTDDYGRRFVSLAAVRMLLDSTWIEAAEALGWRSPRASQSMKSHAQSRLRSAGSLAAVNQHISGVLIDLDTRARRQPHALPDYRAQRERWSQTDAVDRADWRAVSDQAATTRLLRSAAAWRWEHVGHNWIEDYPVFVNEDPGMRELGADASERQRYEIFVRHLTLDPDLATRLTERLAGT